MTGRSLEPLWKQPSSNILNPPLEALRHSMSNPEAQATHTGHCRKTLVWSLIQQEIRVTIIAILYIPATAQTRAAVLQTLREALDDTRAFAGCEGLELLVNQDDNANFVVYKRCRSVSITTTTLAGID